MRQILWVFSFIFALVSCTKNQVSGPGENCALVSDTVSIAKSVCFENRNGMAIIEGDILLGPVAPLKAQSERIRQQSSNRAAVAKAAGGVYRWPNRIIPYTIDPSLPLQNRITEAIAHIHQNTSIRFQPRNGESNFVHFQDDGSGCNSYVGVERAFSNGSQPINLALGCNTGSTIHEMGHAIGLWHEQQRADRDQNIIVHLENVESQYRFAFDRQIIFSQDIGDYDFGSIMHYEPFAFSMNGLPTITRLDGSTAGIGGAVGLSAGDIAAIQTIYSDNFVEAPSWLPIDIFDPFGSPVIALSQTEIMLSINNNSPESTDLSLEYSTNASGPWSRVFLGRHEAVWLPIIQNLTTNTEYHFRARAHKNTANSTYTPIIRIKTADSIPNAPSNLVLNYAIHDGASVIWQDNSSNEDGFLVDYQKSGSDKWTSIPVSANTNHSYISGLLPQTTYLVRVRARNSRGASLPSNELSLTTRQLPPNPPDNVRLVNATQNSIKIAWDDLSSDETGFVILRTGGLAGTRFAQVGSVGANIKEFEDIQLPPGQSFLYLVKAVRGQDESGESLILFASTLFETPSAPTGVVLSLTRNRRVNINWIDTSSNETNFIIKSRASLSSPWVTLGAVPANTRFYSGSWPFRLNSTQFFQVVAKNQSGESASTEVMINISVPPAPVLNTVLPTSKTEVKVNWTDRSNNETGFEVWRKVGNGAYSKIATTGANAVSYSAISLPKTTYRFKVRAINALGASIVSREIVATTPK